MLRRSTRQLGVNNWAALSIWQYTASLSFRALHGGLSSSDEQEAARSWFATFVSQGIPRKSYEITYSRSSGPGGQNVNKTNSKATLRLRLANLSPAPPRLIYEKLGNTKYSAGKGEALVIQADSSRAQRDNQEECYLKLDRLIHEVCNSVIIKEASPEQQAKVKRLQKAADEKRLTLKKKQSSKKRTRKSSFSD